MADFLARSLQTEMVALVPVSALLADGSAANTLRLSFSRTDEGAIAESVKRLGRVLRAGLSAALSPGTALAGFGAAARPALRLKAPGRPADAG